MKYKIRLKGKTHFICEKLELDTWYWQKVDLNKNLYKKREYGVAYLVCKEIYLKSIWDGHQHIEIGNRVKISLSKLNKIETRSDLAETNEKWKTLVKVKHPCPFKYEPYKLLAKKLKEHILENNE